MPRIQKEIRESYLLQGCLLRRVQKFLLGIQYLLESIICDPVKMESPLFFPDRVDLPYHVRWWNPAAWVGWTRTIVFGDLFGAAYYRRKRTDAQNTKQTT